MNSSRVVDEIRNSQLRKFLGSFIPLSQIRKFCPQSLLLILWRKSRYLSDLRKFEVCKLQKDRVCKSQIRKCHIRGKSANLINYKSPQITDSDLRNFFPDAHLSSFEFRTYYSVYSLEKCNYSILYMKTCNA
jgi:hypothetical protein